jgi:hypothetical protein
LALIQGILVGSCIAIALSAAAGSGATTSEDGRRAYDAGHFSDAMGIWSELSRQGNAEAAFGLGLLYDLGNGTPEDAAAAFSWYQVAAQAGLPTAEFNVAAMYDSGRGVPRDAEKAALWYAKAAAHGHHRAQYDLGLLYADGEGVPRNPDAAAAWLHEASAGGITAAQERLRTLAHDRPTGALLPVTLASPSKNETLPLTGQGQPAELVWLAPAEPEPVHYEIEVREIGGSTIETIFRAQLTTTAVSVALPPRPGFYVWNVDTVGPTGIHVPGVWNWFSVGAPAPSPGTALGAAPAPAPGPDQGVAPGTALEAMPGGARGTGARTAPSRPPVAVTGSR